MSFLSGLVDVRAEERRTTFGAFGTLLAITTGHTLMETARDALFLTKLPAAHLPWMYLVIVAFALGLAQLGKSKGGAKTDSKAAIGMALIGAAVVTSTFWVLVKHVSSPWVLYALYVWSGLFASWVTVQFWTLLGRIHTMTQAKRLYGFIGGGAVLGGVVGAVLARAVVVLSPRTALLAAASLFVVAVAPAMMVRVPESDPEAAPIGPAAEDRDAKKRGSMSAGMTILWSNAFARRVLGIVLVSTITVTLADFLFKSEVARAMPDARVLAAYLSTFYAVTNALALVAQVFVAPWVFRTYGVQRALFFFPVLVVMAAGGVLATAGALMAAVGLKLLDGTFRYSIHRTSTELLLVPVPDATRERIKPIVDLIGSRGGQAIASVAILVLVMIGANNALTVGAFVLTLAVIWVALVVTIRRLYLDVFRDTLKAGGLTGKAELPELDLGALETLFAGLNSSLDLDVLASLELLADQKRERLIPALILYHPSRDVVLRALEIFTVRGRTDFVSIADRLNGHPDREVAAAALRARTAVAPDKELLLSRLEDKCNQVSATALVALIARGWISDEEAKRHIEATFPQRRWETAAELARSIRDISAADGVDATIDQRLDELLIRLAREASSFAEGAKAVDADLAEPRPHMPQGRGAMGQVTLRVDVRIQLEVARAMAARKKPEFLPSLLSMLARHELRAAARAAILEIPDALAALEEAMANPDLSRDVRVHLPRTIAMFEPARASRVLLPRLLVETDGAVRFKVLRSLVRMRRATPDVSLDDGVLLRAAEANLDHAVELRRWGAALGGVSDEPPSSLVSADPLRAAHHLLVDLVRDKETHATQRLFLVLELLYGEDFEDIARGLKSKDAKRRASSLELVENLVKQPLKARVLALVGDAPAKTAKESAHPEMAYDDAVLEILAKGGATMRTLAEYRAVELGIDVAAITGRRSAAPGPLDQNAVAKRLFDKARDLFAPETPATPAGASRAPA